MHEFVCCVQCIYVFVWQLVQRTPQELYEIVSIIGSVLVCWFIITASVISCELNSV